MSQQLSGEQIMQQASERALRAGEQRTARRVVITGTGVVSPAGFGTQTLWNQLMSGEAALSQLPDETRESFGVNVAGLIPGYDPLEAGFSKKETRRLALFSQYAILASDEAMQQSGLDLETEDLTRFSCVFGSGIGGLHIFEHESVVLNTKGPKRVSPLLIPTMISNMAAGNLAIRYGLKSECTNIVTACATGTHCIGEAYRSIRFGYSDIALAGGTEESTSPVSLAGFCNLGAISKADDPKNASKPFDVNRSGFIAGDGAGALVLEELEHAQARGANIIAEIVGFGSTGDGYHITAPEPSGASIARAMAQALAEGGFTVDELSQLNAHGTATHANDLAESTALHLLAGDATSKIAVMSVKGCCGHMLGAAGAVEAIVAALSAQRSIVPPSIGCTDPDPECDVSVATSAIKDAPQKVILSNSLGFGGHNGSLAIAPFKA